MKKLLVLLMSLVIALSYTLVFAACGVNDADVPEGTVPEDTIPEEKEEFIITYPYGGSEIDLSPTEFSDYLGFTDESDIAEWLYNNDSLKLLSVASKKVAFKWGSTVKNANSFTLVVSDKDDFSNEIRSVTTTKRACSVEDLLPGEYYYKITDNLGNETATDSFRIVNYVRSFKVSSVNNMRDIGGWKTEDGKTVKYGLTYRSGELNSGCGNALTDLGIKWEIDLRAGSDYTSSVVPDGFNINYLQAGIMQGDYVLKDKSFYDLLTPEQIEAKRHGRAPFQQSYADALYNAFKLYTDEANYPILFHCTSGADRTGTFAFLLEGLLGVELDDLYRDFELTSINMAGKRWRSNIDIDKTTGKYYFTDDGFVTRDGNYIAIGLLYKGLMYSYAGEDGKLSTAIKNYLKTDVGLTDGDIQAIIDIMVE